MGHPAMKASEPQSTADAPCASTRAAKDFANSPAMEVLRRFATSESAKIRAADAERKSR